MFLVKLILTALGILAGGMTVLTFKGPRVTEGGMIIRQASDGVLSVDETKPAVGLDCGPTPFDGVPFRLTLPADAAATVTLAVIFTTSDTVGGTYTEEDRFNTNEVDPGATGHAMAGVYRKRIVFRRRFLKVFFDMTNAGNVGAADLRAESAGEYDNALRDL